MDYFNQILFITISRTLCTVLLYDKVKDTLTPSRIAALIHGINATISIYQENWYEAVSSTGIFFVLDLYFHFLFRTRINLEMKFHHVAGALLCLYSVFTKSFDSSHHIATELTRALILMETTNPLLQLLVTIRNENLQHYFHSYLLYGLKFIFLFQFVFIRIVMLGKAIYITSKNLYLANSLELSMFWMSSAMFCLQMLWLGKIIQSVRSV